jgi:IclR family acetate operon transcriptional repressor
MVFMEKNNTRKTLIQSIERALQILEIVRDKAPIRAIDIARNVGLSSAAANNIARTLYIKGYLSQDESGKYILGTQSYLLGAAADHWSSLRDITEEPMRRLNKLSGNTCFLGVCEEHKIIAVKLIDGTGVTAAPAKQEWLEQLHCTAVGKVILSKMSQSKIAELKNDYPLMKMTEDTITDWSALEKELEKTRVCGYALCKDESVFGWSSIAVSIEMGNSNVALAMAFSSYFLNPEYEKKMLILLKDAVNEIKQRLNIK